MRKKDEKIFIETYIQIKNEAPQIDNKHKIYVRKIQRFIGRGKDYAQRMVRQGLLRLRQPLQAG